MDWEMIRQEFNALKAQVEKIERLLHAGEKPVVLSENIRGPLYGIEPGLVGLHVLKDKWCQKSYIREHCDELLKSGVLEQTIKKTRSLAPQRNVQQGFLVRDEFRTPIEAIAPGSEREMEAKLYQLYDISDPNAGECQLWKGICARQVPLFDAAARAGWGHIDLLAVGNGGQPTVIELKLHKGKNPEPPQRPLFEGTAYAIALQECWDSFWPEWDGVLANAGLSSEEVRQAKKIDVVLLAPDSYWDHWRTQQQYKNARASFQRLTKEFLNIGVNVRCAGFNLEGSNPDKVRDRPDFLEQ